MDTYLKNLCSQKLHKLMISLWYKIIKGLNPSIGILLCPDADKIVVEYAMSRSMSPTLITEYKRILIPQERMQEQLNEYCNLFLEEQNNTND